MVAVSLGCEISDCCKKGRKEGMLWETKTRLCCHRYYCCCCCCSLIRLPMDDRQKTDDRSVQKLFDLRCARALDLHGHNDRATVVAACGFRDSTEFAGGRGLRLSGFNCTRGFRLHSDGRSRLSGFDSSAFAGARGFRSGFRHGRSGLYFAGGRGFHLRQGRGRGLLHGRSGLYFAGGWGFVRDSMGK